MADCRQRVVVPISGRLFEELLTTGNTIVARCVDGLPDGARFIAMQYDGMRDEWLLVFEHESFEPVEEAKVLPRKMITYVHALMPEDAVSGSE